MNQLWPLSSPSLQIHRQKEGMDSGAFHQVSKFFLHLENSSFVFSTSAERSIFPWDRSSISAAGFYLLMCSQA